MKTKILMALGFVLSMVVASFGATFPTADNHTLVSSVGNGVVTVKAAGETGWEMILYCQDNLRSGCGNKFGVKPFEVSGEVAKYQIPEDAVKDGQIAFNFKKAGLWLAIPDCRVKTTNKVAMGMSFYTPEIVESGGAHFVYTGGGIQPWSPIDSGNWCDERAAKVAPAPNTTKPLPVSGGVGVVSNSNAAQAVGAVNKNSAANTAGDEVVGSPMNVVVKIGTCGGKKLKKGESCDKNGHVVNVYAVKHGDTNVSQKGHVVKNNTFKGKAYIYNAPVYNYHGGKSGYTDCSSCHNNQEWQKHEADRKAKDLFFRHMTTSKKGK